MGGTLEPFIPSVVIALSTCGAFAAGRLAARASSRSRRATRFVRFAVVTAALAAVAFFLASHSSRWALLLPAALVAGTVSFSRREPPRGLFDAPQ